MSVITLDYPLENLPGLPAQEGQRFQGCVRGGKVHVTVQVPEPSQKEESSTISRAMTREEGAKQFVAKWSGAFTRPTEAELDEDPRLAYLTAKHLR